MTRTLVAILIAGSLLGLTGCSKSPAGLEEHARERLERYLIWADGKAEYDELLPDKPMIALSLRGAPILDTALRPLVHLNTLRQLDLSDCNRLTGWAMIYLKGQANLKKIDLSGTTFRDDGLETLSQIASLEEINLSRCLQVSDLGMGQLAKLRKLRVLDVRDARFITATGVWQFLQGRPDVDVKHWWVDEQRVKKAQQ